MAIQTPGVALQLVRQGTYTGYESDGTTVVNADLKPGAILQLAGVVPSGQTAVVGNLFSRPTEGYAAPCAIVSEDFDKFNQDVVNTQDGIVANLRRGGSIPLSTGYTRALVKHGVALVAGVTLLAPTDDQFHLTPWVGAGLMGEITAASTAIVDSVSTEQTYSNGSYTIPANSLRPGDVIRGRVHVGAITGGAGTLTVKVKYGSTIIAVTGAPVIVTGDFVTVDYAMTVRTIGATGTAVASSISHSGTAGAAAGAADIPTGSGLAVISTLDTTAAVTISVTAQWSTTASTSSCALQMHNMYLDRLPSSIAFRPFAVAMETTTINDATNGQALAKVAAVGSIV